MKPFQRIACAVALAAGLAAPAARAGLVNDVPSCYAAFHLTQPHAAPDKLVYILLDQTVKLDPALQQSVLDNVSRMIQPGSTFVIAEFSAFSQNHYLQVLHTGIVENPLPSAAYDSLPMTQAPQIRGCFSGQLGFARKMAQTTANQVMATSSSSFDQSDIMAALQEVGPSLRQSSAQHKVLFLVTDALENSSITSFYAHDAVRDVDPRKELAKASAAHMFADLGGARVYVLGSALMPPAAHGTRAQRDGYRDPRVLQHLKAFWEGYFRASHADLVEFGEPALVEPVSYSSNAK